MNSILVPTKLKYLKEISNVSVIKFAFNLHPKISNQLCDKNTISTFNNLQKFHSHNLHNLPPIFKNLENITPRQILNVNQRNINILTENYSTIVKGSSYAQHCYAKISNNKLTKLGAKNFYPLTFTDVKAKIPIESKVEKWIFKFSNNLSLNKFKNPDLQEEFIDPNLKQLNVIYATDEGYSDVIVSKNLKNNKTSKTSVKQKHLRKKSLKKTTNPTFKSSIKSSTNTKKELNILFGTQCGLSEDIAHLIGEEAEKRGYKVTVNGANKIPMDKFKIMKNVLIVTSTVDGTFPPSIFKFYNRITTNDKDKLNLSNMKYSVLGLGSTSKEKFCEASRLINKRLEELGAKTFYPYTTFDDQDKEDIEIKIEKYMDKLFNAFLNNVNGKRIKSKLKKRIIDESKFEPGSKLTKEREVCDLMIELYCNDHHHIKKGEMCPKCKDLSEYMHWRLSLCPFGNYKSFCSNCPIHCYKQEYKENIKKVMRYSGPRMIFVHPYLAIKHVIESLIEKNKGGKGKLTDKQKEIVKKVKEENRAKRNKIKKIKNDNEK